VAENFFYVFREVWIKDRGFTGFFFVCLGQRDALRDAAAHRFGDMKDRNGPRAILEGYRDFLAFSTLRTCAILIVSACLWWI
jgi:hypothetical protein